MNRIFLLLLTGAFFITSCSKSNDTPRGCTFTESTVVAPGSEVATLQVWINANRPAAIQHASGLFYEIITPGTGTITPGVCSTITVKYTGTTLNGVKFDENLVGAQFVLGSLILGWQKGVPLIKKGGLIYLYIPPTLGYGTAGSGSIPPDTYIKFSIELVDVK